MGCGRHAQFPLGHGLRHGRCHGAVLRRNSPIFAIAAVLSIIVMYDAMGVRYETGEQAKVLNRMFTEWMDQGFEQFQLPHGKKLKEMVGHTPIEVLTGAALGIVLGFAMPMV